MQKLISKYGLAAHLAVLAVAPLFLSATAVFWLSALVAVWVMMEPSRIGGEMLHDARSRVCKSLLKDSLWWAMLLVTIFALVRYLNDGVSLAYDAEQGVWSISSPQIEILPGVVKGSGLSELSAACALLVIFQGVRHALGRSARGVFALMVSFLSGSGAIVCYVLSVNAHRFEIGNMGTAFGICFALSVVALSEIFDRGWYKSLPIIFVAIAGNAIGLFAFASPCVAIAFAAIALVIFIYAFVYVRVKLGNPAEFRFLVLFAFPVAFAYAMVVLFMPAAEVQSRIAPYLTGIFIPESFLTVRKSLSAVSLKIWESHPWIGTGLGSYVMDLGFFADASLWETVPPTQSNPMNGYWLLLIERGTVGAFVLAAILVLLVYTYIKRLIRGVRTGLPPGLAFVGVLVIAVAACEMLIDGTVLCSGIMVLVATAFSLSASSFPRESKGNGR